MRKLRASLIQLFQKSWGGNGPNGRIKAAIIQQAQALLAIDAVDQYGLSYRLLSHEQLHRYVLVIHCPDQAFYPDAIRTYLQKQKLQPIQQQSVLFSVVNSPTQVVQPEMGQHENSLFLVLHLSAATTDHIEKIQQDIKHILEGVHQSVSDFPEMRSELERIAIYLAHDDHATADLLQWMIDDHYLFFGLGYDGKPRKNKGISKNKRLLSWLLPEFNNDLDALKTAVEPGMDWLNFASTFSHLYSAANVKVVRISWLEDDQLHSVVLIGHFSRGARYINASQLPKLQHIWSNMAQDVSLQVSAFYKREIRTLFDRTPKSLLHSIPVTQWLEPFKNILDMNSPTQVVVSKLTPKVGNIDYLLIAVDGQRFGSNIWAQMQRAMAKFQIQLFGSEYYSVGSTQLIFVAVYAQTWPQTAILNVAIQQCVVFWKDQAKQRLLNEGLPAGLLHDALLELSQISNAYQDHFPPEQFVRDILLREQLKRDGKTKVRLTLHQDDNRQVVEIHVVTPKVLPLGVMTEKLNAFALVAMEQSLIPFHQGEQFMHICRFRCEAPEQLHAEGLPRLRQGIQDVFNQLADHDGLNALLILSGLGIRDVMVLITLRNHLSQLMPEVSIAALSEVMIKHYHASKYLFRIFEGKHRLSMPVTHVAQAKADFNREMNQVLSLKDDTWLRALEMIVDSSLRSNAWQREAGEAVAIKIDPSQFTFAPKPKPFREIFVHGVFVEGVHLRAGAIARGGLRFSDRPTDFRTEVLELMATQVVKNGQIVPTGAKGGFVVRDGAGADFILAQYHSFIRALLSITDNRLVGESIPPKGVAVANQDVDDAYLVVAADKGTARYSDDANEEALAAGFWLGDAFASGGSHGYDHKAFGITARGAWACAAHHFSRIGVNLWQDEVSVVGIGDMAGDVFGNGMLLNPNLKLVAAFNHVHVFLDPNPDIARSFAERERLFAAGLGWGDYNTSIISEGGGVFNRASKSIVLHANVQAVLGLDVSRCSGEALIRAILQAPVDLLYNGGIGTYIKASFESDLDAQDPANNAVRVSANTLRCKVLNEGGNLGLTQAARIEYAQNKGIINTDAIDNAAGVNMSDHEVNLKILLADETFSYRNKHLKSVANFVAEQCIHDNKAQAIALSFAELTAEQHLPRLKHLQRYLHHKGYLDTYVKDEKIFTLRPMFSEWLGHEKNRVHQALDDMLFCGQSMFGAVFLLGYFPVRLRKKYKEKITDHPLANDIAHTRMTSYILNRYGLTCINYLQNLTSSHVSETMQSLLIADTLLNTGQMYEEQFVHADGDLQGWYNIQQYVLSFAEGILALKSIMAIDEQWLKLMQKALVKYGADQNLDIAQITALVTAIPLHEKTDKALVQCLQVTQLCLEKLPFSLLEASLRTPLWASDDAHALRCEWLGRLVQLKIQAAENILELKGKHRDQVLQAWHTHPLQDKLVHLLNGNSEAPQEEQRLRYILAMAHLQTIVDEG